MKIDPNKKYRTKEGYDVRFLHRVPDGWPTQYPWRGIICDGTQMSWTDDGSQDVDQSPNDGDLIEVREPREWVIRSFHNGRPAIWSGPNMEPEQEIRVREIID